MSTNEFFEHKVIPQNSPTSPTENLATEVSEAFDNVSSLLSRDTIYPSLSKAIGNFILNDVSYHGFSQTRSDTFSVSASTKDLPLSFTPVSNVSLSYVDGATGSQVYLTQKQPTQELTSKRDFKVLGRVIVLGGNYVGLTLKASYTGVEANFGDLSLKPNILRDTNKTYLKPLVEVTPTQFTLTYDVNLQSLFDKYFNVALDSGNIFLLAKKSGNYSLIKYDSLALNGNILTVTIDRGLEEDYTEVLVYVLNVTIADMLEALYKEVTTHTHSKEGVTKPIDHKSILNSYQNSNRIYYKDSEVANYPHPQFLNREGYNPSISSAYENAMLGDLFLSATISDTDQTFKSLTKDSVRLMFGDPVAGSKLYFDSTLKTLNLLTGAGLNGLNISVGNGFKAISINNNTSISEFADETRIKGKNNKVKIVGDGVSNATLETKDLIATGMATLAQANVSLLVVGNTKITTDGVDTTFSSINPDIKTKIVYIDTTTYKDVIIEKGSIVIATLTDSLKTNDDNYLQNQDGNFNFVVKEKTVGITQHSGKDSGFSIGTQTKKRKTYSSDYLGKLGSSIDTNFYVETPRDSATYYLRSTDEAVSFNSRSYVFQKDVSGSIRIDNLQDWFRATAHFGELSADRLALKGSDENNRNGLTIDTTRISVIGTGMDCPEGVTIFESAEAVHIVRPLGKNNVDCKTITYQGLNTGNLQVFGEAAIEGSLTVVGNTTISEILTTNALVVNTTANIRELAISGESSFSGTSTFIGAVDVSNNMTVSGAIDLTGSLSASDGTFDKFVSIGDTLTVEGQAIFGDNIIAQGNLTVTRDFTTSGSLTAGDIKVGDARLGSVTAQGFIHAIGGLTAEGLATLKGNLDVAGNLVSQGSADFSGDVTASSLYITSDTTLMGRLVTDGPVTMTTNSFTVGATDATLLLYGTLQVTGLRSTFSGSVNIQGELVASSSVRVSESLTCTGPVNAVTINVGADATVKGTLTAGAAEFTRKAFFLDGLKTMGASEMTKITAEDVTSKSMNADDMYIKNTLSMGPDAKVVAYTVEASEIIQKDPSNTSTFAGKVVFNNLAQFTNKLIIGNPDIEYKRSTSGCLITDNQIKLGNNSTIEAIKFFAAKGSPVAGNRDLNAGYTFASSYVDSGVDGDTGLFATQGQDVGLDGSDIEIWIDGVRKYIFPKYEVAYSNKEVKNREVAVTLDMLQKMQADLEAKISASVVSTNSASWPVGSIFQTMSDSDPYVLFKFGTWIRFAPGRTLVGRVTGKTDEQGGVITDGIVKPTDWAMNNAGATYGDFKHAMRGDENGPHVHLFKDYYYPERPRDPAIEGAPTEKNPWGTVGSKGTDYDNPTVMYHPHDTEISGKGTPHNNVQPSIIVNIWQRIA